MQEDLVLRLRAGADILLQCPEHVRLNRKHAPMDANLHRRADEASEAADEIERLRTQGNGLADRVSSLLTEQKELYRTVSEMRGDLETARNVYKCNSGIGPTVKR